MDGSMDFADAIFSKPARWNWPSTLEVNTKLPPGKAALICLQHREARVRAGASVQVEAVAVEAPGQGRGAREGVGAGDLLEGDAGLGEGRIGAPEAGVAAEVGQPESTPMPAPAAMMRASAPAMRRAASVNRGSVMPGR
jgi:hypothetical protein